MRFEYRFDGGHKVYLSDSLNERFFRFAYLVIDHKVGKIIKNRYGSE